MTHIIEFSDSFRQAWDQVSAARLAARDLTVTEMRRFLPKGATHLTLEWVDDIDSGRLWLNQITTADGTVIEEDALDTEGPEWDALDELVSYLAEDWEDASSYLLRAPNMSGQFFIIDFTEGTTP